MLLSNLLKQYNVTEKYSIINEQNFETLALAGGKTQLSFCTFLE